jgi:uncharacterized membrane protein (UPF0127 family)
MRIVNTTRQTVLAERAWATETAGQRMKGLLGRDGLEPGQALYISPCTSIHSFFMRFVFDAAFIARSGEVLHLIHRMRPWRMSKIVPSAAGVIELPAGVLEQTGTARADQIRFEP